MAPGAPPGGEISSQHEQNSASMCSRQLRPRSYTLCHSRIGEIRPLILRGLRSSFFEAFCHSDDVPVYVVDDAALLIEGLHGR